MSSGSSEYPPTLRQQAPGPAMAPGAGQAAPPAVAASSAGRSGNALKAGTRFGELELCGVIGEGGFGIVYTAHDHALERRVAVKEYMPAAMASRGPDGQVRVRSEEHRDAFAAGLRSFVNEARLLAQFDHPALLKVYRFWEADGTAYMVMPLYQGVTLKDRLRAMASPPDEAWLMALIGPLTEALAVLHAQHCYHRDVAPDNVLLLSDGERPLLLDFGAARRVIGDMTQALTAILKPGYAPVEQYADAPDMKQGPWTDVYALAATLHYAITGKPPPPAVARLVHDDYQPLAVVADGRYSERFLRAIDHALRIRPAERTASVDELRDDLGLHRVSQPTTMLRATAIPLKPGTTTASGRGMRTAAIAGGTAAVLAAAAVAYFASRPSAPPVAASTPAAPVQPAPTVAPPAPTPASPAPQTPATLDVAAEFGKVLAGQFGGFEVRAEPRATVLRIGKDRLAFDVTSSRDGFVHVLVRDASGALLLLFPNAQSSENAVRAGHKLTLPQASWMLDTVEPAGRAEFLVVISAQPRDYSALGKERDYWFLKLPTGEAGGALAAGWTRSTPLLLGGLGPCTVSDCEAYGAATFGVDVKR